MASKHLMMAYSTYTVEDHACIGNYAAKHGSTNAACHFSAVLNQSVQRVFFVHLLYFVELNKQQLKFPLLTRYVANIKFAKFCYCTSHKTITSNISVFTIHLNTSLCAE